MHDVMDLVFVVNGEEIPVAAATDATLRAVVATALIQSENTTRPLEEWELRYETGVAIPDQDQPIATCGFRPGTCLYLTLRVGAGGSARAQQNPQGPRPRRSSVRVELTVPRGHTSFPDWRNEPTFAYHP